MQFFGDLFANKLIAAILVVLVLAVVGLFILWRVLLGKRVAAGGPNRTRQPRLGIVDAFDLDRQRQLVIVRRDNVEHLLMIGGPNDLVVETQIVRTLSASTPVVGTRDKEFSVPVPAVLAPPPATAPILTTGQAPLSPNAGPSPAAAQPAAPEVGGATAPVRSGNQPPSAAPRLAPTGPAARPTSPFPPRSSASGAPGSTPLPKPAGLPPRPPLTPVRPALHPTRSVKALAVPVPSVREPRPDREPKLDREPKSEDERERSDQTTVDADEVRQGPEPVNKEPVLAVGPRVEPRVEPSAPRLVSPTPLRSTISGSKATSPVRSLDALESLEEEMAKLLGRPVPPAEKS